MHNRLPREKKRDFLRGSFFEEGGSGRNQLAGGGGRKALEGGFLSDTKPVRGDKLETLGREENWKIERQRKGTMLRGSALSLSWEKKRKEKEKKNPYVLQGEREGGAPAKLLPL